MPIVKHKEVPQELWLGDYGYSKDGVCFYMSEYVQTKTWADGSYDDVVKAAKVAVPDTIMKAGKAKNLADRRRTKMFTEWPTYSSPAALADNRIYRIALWFGNPAHAPATSANPLIGRNHAAVAATGQGGSVLLFEPNFGFYESTTPAANQKTLLETLINSLYAATGDTARNFIYLRGRGLTV